MKPIVAFDIEVFRNYFLVKFKRHGSGAIREFEMSDGSGYDLDVRGILDTISRCTLIGFNSNKYDVPMLAYALSGASCEQLKGASDFLINSGVQPWQFVQRLSLTLPQIDHIDLIEVVPGMVGLKIYGGRMHAPKMQDLPLDHDALVEPDDRQRIRDYCGNDLDITLMLFDKFRKQIELRAQMSKDIGVDLRSKSDAQIAEAILKDRIARRIGHKISKPEIVARSFKYRFPDFVSARGEPLSEVIELVRDSKFVVDAGGYVQMPKNLADAKIRIGNGVYRMGLGGLHSSEKSVAHHADSKTLLVDRDVASFYPAIIIETELFPKHLGRHFLQEYRDIRDRRITAKRAGDKTTADTLKIVLNGSFGKFGSPYSTLYSPDLLIQTTVTGQLSLLMLIERIEAAGIAVISANTDGIVIKCPKARYDTLLEVIAEWEFITNFETEETRYNAIYSRDVNNYIAIKEHGGIKLKGAYAPPEPVASSWPSPHNQICVEAVCNLIEFGIPIEATICECTDVRQFVTIRTVKGGAMWRGEYVGKAVRWIASTIGDQPMRYRTTGNKVPNTDYCRPLMELPTSLPSDIDFDYYIAEANGILKDISYT